MPMFDSGGVKLAYIDEGEDAGDPILLIHGFASSVAMNWQGPGWVDVLTKAGYRVIAIDNRGHGLSEKLYELEDYGAPLMAQDARRLLNHLGIRQADVMGYSMGARITAFLAMGHPGWVRSAVFGGFGINLVRPRGGSDDIAQALEADSIDDVTTSVGITFRRFAEKTGSDLRALAACIRSARVPVTAEGLAQLKCPVLVAVGSDDEVGGNAAELAAILPRGEAFEIMGRDHMKATGDATFKTAVLEFLSRRA